MKRARAILLALSLSATALAAAPGDGRLYQREHQVTLPGSGDSWGFAALDPTRPYLFLARRENGLSVFDVAKQRPVKILEHSAGSGSSGPAGLAPVAAVAFPAGRQRRQDGGDLCEGGLAVAAR